MLQTNQQNIKIHCNTFHNIFCDFFNTTPFDALGYIYYDEKGNYFGIQSDTQMFDRLFNPEIQHQVICNYYTKKIQTIYVENTQLPTTNPLLQIIAHMQYKSIIRIVTNKKNITEFISFYSKQNCPTTASYFLNNHNIIQNTVNTIQRRISLLANENSFTQISIKPDSLQKHEPEINYLANCDKNDEDLFLCTKGLPLNMDKFKLINKEKEIAVLMYYGFNLNEIAEKIEVSRRTIDRRLNSIRHKLNCKSNISIIPLLLDENNAQYCVT